MTVKNVCFLKQQKLKFCYKATLKTVVQYQLNKYLPGRELGKALKFVNTTSIIDLIN